MDLRRQKEATISLDESLGGDGDGITLHETLSTGYDTVWEKIEANINSELLIKALGKLGKRHQVSQCNGSGPADGRARNPELGDQQKVQANVHDHLK